MSLFKKLGAQPNELVARLLLAEVLAKRGQGPLQRPKRPRPVRYEPRPVPER